MAATSMIATFETRFKSFLKVEEGRQGVLTPAHVVEFGARKSLVDVPATYMQAANRITLSYGTNQL